MRLIRADELLRTVPPENAGSGASIECARCTIAGVTIEMRSNVPGLAGTFARRYSDHPANGAADFAYNVLQDESGYTMWCGHDGAWRWPAVLPSLEAVLFLADAAAIAALVHFDEHLASLHAAGVECFGVAAAIAADSEGGKTTTALACARIGMRVYSDERVLLHDRTVLPFLRRTSPRPASMRLLDLRASSPISWSEVFGPQCVAAPAPLQAVFVITGKGDLEIKPAEPAFVLKRIARWFDCTGSALQRLSRALELLQQPVRCYALNLGAPGETAQALMSALERVAAS